MVPDTVPETDARTETTWARKRCARCGAGFRCGADTPSCWCDGLTLTAEQRARLADLRLEGCLCRDCLEAI
jgi:hypothetical protein